LSKRLGNPQKCSEQDPTLRQFDGSHLSACHFAESIESTVA
jgi:hypothetical protein